MNRPFAIAMGLVGLALALAACNSSSSSSDSSTSTAAPTVAMTVSGSATTLAVGYKIGAVDVSNTAASCGGTYGTPVHIGTSAAITTAGATTTMTVTPNQSGTSYLESYYIDVDASGTLTNGDKVWGTSTTGFKGACFAPGTRTTPDDLNWDTVASQLGGSATWAGGAQAYSAEPGTSQPGPADAAPIEIQAVQGFSLGLSH